MHCDFLKQETIMYFCWLGTPNHWSKLLRIDLWFYLHCCTRLENRTRETSLLIWHEYVQPACKPNLKIFIIVRVSNTKHTSHLYIYYTYLPLDRLWSGLEQGISFIEDGISCKSMYMMYVFCLKDALFLPGTLSKYVLWTYYLKIIAVWKSPVLFCWPLQNVGTDCFWWKKVMTNQFKQYFNNIEHARNLRNCNYIYSNERRAGILVWKTDEIWSIKTDLHGHKL